MDDDWLTSSFFLTLNREQLDGVRETLDQSNGPSGELNTQKILLDSYAGTMVVRNKVRGCLSSYFVLLLIVSSCYHLGCKLYTLLILSMNIFCVQNDPYTSKVQQVDDQLMEQYRVWKERQLLATILREQIKKQVLSPPSYLN